MNQAPPDYEFRALPLHYPACLISSDEHAIRETKFSIPMSLICKSTGKPRQGRKAAKEKITKRKRTTKSSNRNVTAGEETKIPNKM